MAVNLLKPDPFDGDGPVADVVDLVPADDGLPGEEEGEAEGPSRLRAWWATVLEEGERRPDTLRARSVRWPALGPYLVDRGGLAAVKVGAVVIFRGCWTLIRSAWALAFAGVAKARGRGLERKAAAAPASGRKDESEDDAGDETDETPAKDGPKKALAKKDAAQKGKKKAPAPQKKVTADVVLGAVVLGIGGLYFVQKNVIPGITAGVAGVQTYVGDHPLDVLRGDRHRSDRFRGDCLDHRRNRRHPGSSRKRRSRRGRGGRRSRNALPRRT
ncbi:hypothetical protein [Streptomyces sp. NPDC048644]|uniref:hypothetical protein n=1 Tax=Streptomyces sp. NPDC048644 TaxID=3365582 RepID=UPI003710A241